MKSAVTSKIHAGTFSRKNTVRDEGQDEDCTDQPTSRWEVSFFSKRCKQAGNLHRSQESEGVLLKFIITYHSREINIHHLRLRDWERSYIFPIHRLSRHDPKAPVSRAARPSMNRHTVQSVDIGIDHRSNAHVGLVYNPQGFFWYSYIFSFIMACHRAISTLILQQCVILNLLPATFDQNQPSGRFSPVIKDSTIVGKTVAQTWMANLWEYEHSPLCGKDQVTLRIAVKPEPPSRREKKKEAVNLAYRWQHQLRLA